MKSCGIVCGFVGIGPKFVGMCIFFFLGNHMFANNHSCSIEFSENGKRKYGYRSIIYFGYRVLCNVTKFVHV